MCYVHAFVQTCAWTTNARLVPRSVAMRHSESIDKFHKNDYHYYFANNRLFDFSVCYITVFILRLRTPQLFTLFVLKFKQVRFTKLCLKVGGLFAQACRADYIR